MLLILVINPFFPAMNTPPSLATSILRAATASEPSLATYPHLFASWKSLLTETALVVQNVEATAATATKSREVETFAVER